MIEEPWHDVRTTRCITLAALSLQQPSKVDRSLWDERLRRLLRLQAMKTADMRFGNYARACHDHDECETLVEIFHGPRYRPSTPAEAARNKQWREAREAMHRYEAAAELHEELHVRPYEEALRELVHTPAPDLFGARFKVELMAEEELHLLLTWDDVDLMQIVADDMTRLTAEEIELERSTH